MVDKLKGGYRIMASEAQIKQKLLDDELAKSFPDQDIVYALKLTRDYWNTVDTDKMRRGFQKIATKTK